MADTVSSAGDDVEELLGRDLANMAAQLSRMAHGAQYVQDGCVRVRDPAHLIAQLLAASSAIRLLHRELSETEAALAAAERRAEEAEREVARLREALTPFAEYAPYVEMFVEGRAKFGGSPILPTKHFRLADFCRARAALQSGGKE